MANIKSQKKRIKQDKIRNSRNKSLKSELKTALKNVTINANESNKEQAIKALDVAFSKGIIKKSYRDRNKSKISSL